MDSFKAVLRVCAAALIVQQGALASPYLAEKPWIMPFDVNQRFRPQNPHQTPPEDPSQRDIYEFAWQSFIALNWPYKVGGVRGQPDPKVPLAPIANTTNPDKVVVWETYMSPETVFVHPQDWPVVWGQPDFSGLLRVSKPPCYVGGYQYGQPFAPGINQPYTNANVPTGPVVDQNKEYLRVEVTLSQPYFNYIKQFGYYDADTQTSAVKKYIQFANDTGDAPPPAIKPSDDASRFQPLPTGLEFYLDGLPKYALQGMTEVKAAWKVLKTEGEGADIPGRYFRRMMQFPQPDGSLSEPMLMGLVGFHIHRVTPFGHLPSTFEHVDNVRVRKRRFDPLPVPKHPALNPGRGNGRPVRYANGYEVNGESGVAGVIPLPYKQGDSLIPIDEREQVNVSRVTPIPRDVQRVNYKYQRLLKDSVWSYYQLIGTQNKNLETPNRHLGPGIPGPQRSNVQNLVNTTLETYTQKGFSCARCHLNAFPQGVSSFPPYEKRFEDLHVMSFLLLNAKPGSQPPGKFECLKPGY
ncbi:hypothetical protein [Microbulbifer marinus]|uniref:Cytochrome c domain-containing protein n=1 Tax=Microbulbifer marinus TaxID=658218 RepID=A0A1H3VTY0_9GAMM|nr:hypothetical protein [Microbulbifer marinus]SDZ77684.1 hypothetical protein SAMN05216562_0225 [Microbulbifer marinus]